MPRVWTERLQYIAKLEWSARFKTANGLAHTFLPVFCEEASLKGSSKLEIKVGHSDTGWTLGRKKGFLSFWMGWDSIEYISCRRGDVWAGSDKGRRCHVVLPSEPKLVTVATNHVFREIAHETNMRPHPSSSEGWAHEGVPILGQRAPDYCLRFQEGAIWGCEVSLTARKCKLPICAPVSRDKSRCASPLSDPCSFKWFNLLGIWVACSE